MVKMMRLYSKSFNRATYSKDSTSVQLEDKPLSKHDVLEAISDHHTLVLLRHLVSKSEDSQTLLGQVEISRKQYYSRVWKLAKVGLVKRIGSKYAATPLGRVVCEATFSLEVALKMHLLSLHERTANLSLNPKWHQHVNRHQLR